MKTYTVTIQTGPYTFENLTVEAYSITDAWNVAMSLNVKGVVTAVNSKWY